jgi:hypothetical protein
VEVIDWSDAAWDLAHGRWSETDRTPKIDLNLMPTLWPISLMDRLSVAYPPEPTRWASNPHVDLTWETGEPLQIPRIIELNSQWLAPCHALFSVEETTFASISGVLTFTSWLDADEYDDFFNGVDVADFSPMIVALNSSFSFNQERDQAAIENAARIVMKIEPSDAQPLFVALASPRDI